ncbi:hypothetical protein DIE22_04605 [Burkholderia sp. Bp9142]|nr:hypothetical protein DIE22_04605 [Burkholderia sp. Bp9142]RQR57065.1 hypothetical protein DIE21_00820 [Burkholderia sp. Bp9140]
MSRWMALLRAGGCGAPATCCSRVVPEAGAPMSQTRHAFERYRHRWRKPESRAGKTAGRRARGRPERAATGPGGSARSAGPASRARVTRPDSPE